MTKVTGGRPYLPRRGCRTQPRVAYSRTLGNDKPQRPSTPKGLQSTAQGRVLAHPGERQAPTSIYPERVAKHTPGPRHPAPWGTKSPNVQLPRRGCKTHPRVACPPPLGKEQAPRPISPKGVAEHSPGSRTRAPWGTTSPNVHLPRRGCRTQPRVAYSRTLGNDKPQRPSTPKGLQNTAPARVLAHPGEPQAPTSISPARAA